MPGVSVSYEGKSPKSGLTGHDNIAVVRRCCHSGAMVAIRSSIDSARLKRARHRMRGYFFGSGVVLAFLYLLAVAFFVQIFGIEVTRYWSSILMAAGVMLGGTYGLVMLVWLGFHITRRLIQGRPVMDGND